MSEAINNPFATKVKFEQITDSKALKDLMIQKAKAEGVGQISEEVKKLREIKEKEIQQHEEQIKHLKNHMEGLKLHIDQFEQD